MSFLFGQPQKPYGAKRDLCRISLNGIVEYVYTAEKKQEMNENSHWIQKYTLKTLMLSPQLIAYVCIGYVL